MDGSGPMPTPEATPPVPPMPLGEQANFEADQTVAAPEQTEVGAPLPPANVEVQGSGLDPEDLKVPPMFKPPEAGVIGGPGSEVNNDMMAAAARATADGFAASVTRNEPGDPSKQILPPPPEIAPTTEIVQAAQKINDLPPLPPPPAA
jgi:hypothetical protein